tara:strand:+ start:1940 stop:3484 length:1545 start_codon:yes stop_codon:yes gene_type:complete
MKKKSNDDDTIYSSFYKIGKLLAEECYDGKKVFYAVWDGVDVSYMDQLDDGILIKPINSEEVIKKIVKLPSCAEDYGTDEELDNQILGFISKWLDIPDDTKQFALWNIKRSWVFDRFHSLNYLRALGDTGMGKSRFLDTLGAIHYKSINTSGATTSAAIFRVIDKWRGTLIIDEADFFKSDESQDIIKIINLGYEAESNIIRCDQNDAKNLNFFNPYCPKILATRKNFEDKAVESRCITQIMAGTIRNDIPFNLNDCFYKEALNIRNKLLMWRFKNYWLMDDSKNIDLNLELEPRVRQIVNGIVNMFCDDKEQRDKFKVFIKKHQEDLIDERKYSFYGDVLGGIHELMEKGIKNISNQDIIDKKELLDYKGRPMKPRGLTSILKSLGFGRSKSMRIDDKIKRVIPLNKQHLIKLFKRYGYDVTIVTHVMDSPSQPKNPGFSDFEALPKYRNNRNNVTKKELDIIDLTPQNSQEFETNLIEYRKCSDPGCNEYETNPDSLGNPFCRDHWTNYAKK